jgi:hypothetical protein
MGLAARSRVRLARAAFNHYQDMKWGFVYAACWSPSAAERWSRAVSTSRSAESTELERRGAAWVWADGQAGVPLSRVGDVLLGGEPGDRLAALPNRAHRWAELCDGLLIRMIRTWQPRRLDSGPPCSRA